ncbi:MAG: hypothetical protein VX278_00300, partial [Myxococcota bacterium]|nr:hypothetical protein [Myxococcota bacterium]
KDASKESARKEQEHASSKEKLQEALNRKGRQQALDDIKERCTHDVHESQDAEGNTIEGVPGGCKHSVDFLNEMNEKVGGCDSLEDLMTKLDTMFKGSNKQELKAELQKQTTNLEKECIASRQFLAESTEPDLDQLQEQLLMTHDGTDERKRAVLDYQRGETLKLDLEETTELADKGEGLVAEGKEALQKYENAKWYQSKKGMILPLIKRMIHVLCEMAMKRVKDSFEDAMNQAKDVNMMDDLKNHPNEMAYAYDMLPEGLQPQRLQAQREAYYKYIDNFDSIDTKRIAHDKMNRKELLMQEVQKRLPPKEGEGEDGERWNDFQEKFTQSLINGRNEHLKDTFMQALDNWDGFRDTAVEGTTEAAFAIKDLKDIFSAWGEGKGIPNDLKNPEEYKEWLWGKGKHSGSDEVCCTCVVQALGAITMLSKVVGNVMDLNETSSARDRLKALQGSEEKNDPQTEALIHMLNEEFKQAIRELAANGVDGVQAIIKAIPVFGPVVGGVLDVKDMIVALTRMCQDIAKHDEDVVNATDAFNRGDIHAYALEGTAEYDSQRATRNGVEAATKALSAVGGFVQGVPTPEGQVAGKLLKGLGDSIGAISKFVAMAYDEVIAREIIQLRTKAADGDVEAQNRLFRLSQQQAKGLIAVGLQEGNQNAIRFVKSRATSGLTEQDLRNCGLELCREWLLAVDGQELFDQDSAVSAIYRAFKGNIEKKWNARTLRWKLELYVQNLKSHGDELRTLSDLWETENAKQLQKISSNIIKLRALDIDLQNTKTIMDNLISDISELKTDETFILAEDRDVTKAQRNIMQNRINQLKKMIRYQFQYALSINTLAGEQMDIVERFQNNIKGAGEKIETNVARLDGEIATLETEVTDLQQTQNRLQGEVDQLPVNIQQLEGEIRNLVQKKNAQISIVETNTARVEVLLGKEERTEAENTEIEEARTKIRAATEKRDEIQADEDRKTSEKDTLSALLVAKTAELNQTKESIESKTQEKTQKQEERQNLRLEIPKLKPSLEKYQLFIRKYQSLVASISEGTKKFKKNKTP